MIPLHWTWRDLGRALRVAAWAFHHANALARLKQELLDEAPGWDGMRRSDASRARQWLAEKYLGNLPNL